MLFHVHSSTIFKEMWKLFVKANDKENILHFILELNLFCDIHTLIDWSANVTVIKHDQKGLPEERLYMVPERTVHNGEEDTAAGGQNWEIISSSTCMKLVWGRKTKTETQTRQTLEIWGQDIRLLKPSPHHHITPAAPVRHFLQKGCIS